jgi:MSHA biogenesis protein MshL
MFVFHKLQSFSLRPAFKCLLAVGLITSLSGCDLAKNQLRHDRENNAEFQETRDALSSRLPSTEDDAPSELAGSIPDFQPYVASPSDRMKSMPLVSLSVNQTVPLRDVLYELAQQADYDLELDPRIRGSIIFSARNKPFDTVIERISNMAGLRYKFEDDFLRVELDVPYNHVYKVDYLSYIRSNTGSISNNISVVSGDGADSGSNYEASSESESDFWGELEVNLEQIITGAQTGALKTSRDPRITATDQNPDVQAVSPASPDGQVTVQAPDANLVVESLPVDGLDDNSGSNSSDDDDSAGSFTINRQAGLINVFATEKAHKEIREYMKLVKRAVTSQVLIEAKILEVRLNDEYATGIDWNALDLPGEISLNLDTSPTAVTSGSTFVANFGGNDFNALVNATSQFGTIRALASPRMTVLNNQSAVLNVATNEVFFEIEVDTSTADGGALQTDVDSEIRNVPVGVLMNVQPSINLDERTVSLALRPTVTAIADEEADPGVAFAVASVAAAAAAAGQPIPDVPQNLVPELSVQEIDSVIKVNSGQAIVMGGLLQDRTDSSESGVPVASEVPVFGSLFKNHDDTITKTELVIFLKATILDNPEDSVHRSDKDLYRQFSSDRRPLRF